MLGFNFVLVSRSILALWSDKVACEVVFPLCLVPESLLTMHASFSIGEVALSNVLCGSVIPANCTSGKKRIDVKIFSLFESHERRKNSFTVTQKSPPLDLRVTD